MIPVANTRWHRSNLAPDKSRSKSFKHTYFQHFSMLFGTTWPLLSHPASHACVHLWQKQAKNHCVYNIFDSFSEAILGSNMGRTKNVKNATGQIGTVLVSKKMFKTLIFWTLFCYFWALHGICDYVRLHIFQQTNAKYMKKNITFITILTNAARPPWGPRMGRHKYDQPTLTPKSSQGNRTKHWFSQHILSILLFGIHVAIAPSVPFMLKIN